MVCCWGHSRDVTAWDSDPGLLEDDSISSPCPRSTVVHPRYLFSYRKCTHLRKPSFLVSLTNASWLNHEQKVLGKTNLLLSFIRHRKHKKRRVNNFFYGCMCIRCRGNNFIEPLPSNDREITHIDTQTDGSDLWITPSRWAQVPWYAYQVS
jgi:hypothetical protein